MDMQENKNKKHMFFFRLLAVVVLLVIAGAMFVVGRGHTVYFDNKTTEYNGQKVETPYKVEVYVNGEKVAKLYDNERGMADWMGQKFTMRKGRGSEKERGVLNAALCDGRRGVEYSRHDAGASAGRVPFAVYSHGDGG